MGKTVTTVPENQQLFRLEKTTVKPTQLNKLSVSHGTNRDLVISQLSPSLGRLTPQNKQSRMTPVNILIAQCYRTNRLPQHTDMRLIQQILFDQSLEGANK